MSNLSLSGTSIDLRQASPNNPIPTLLHCGLDSLLTDLVLNSFEFEFDCSKVGFEILTLGIRRIFLI